jgi:hypothetical protein
MKQKLRKKEGYKSGTRKLRQKKKAINVELEILSCFCHCFVLLLIYVFIFVFIFFHNNSDSSLISLQLEVQPINLNQECINLIQILNHVFGELDFFIIPSRISFLSIISIN